MTTSTYSENSMAQQCKIAIFASISIIYFTLVHEANANTIEDYKIVRGQQSRLLQSKIINVRNVEGLGECVSHCFSEHTCNAFNVANDSKCFLFNDCEKSYSRFTGNINDFYGEVIGCESQKSCALLSIGGRDFDLSTAREHTQEVIGYLLDKNGNVINSTCFATLPMVSETRVWGERGENIFVPAAGEKNRGAMLITSAGVETLHSSKYGHKFGYGGWIDHSTFLLCGGINQEAFSNLKCEKYDFSTKNWTEISENMPSQSNGMFVMYKGDLYIAGGQDRSGKTTKFIKFNTETNVWADMGKHMPAPAKSLGAAVLYNDKMVVCGGHSSITTCDAFSFADGHWESFPDMNIGKHAFGMSVVGNQIFTFGGSKSIERFDPTLEGWESIWTTDYLLNDLGVASLCSNKINWEEMPYTSECNIPPVQPISDRCSLLSIGGSYDKTEIRRYRISNDAPSEILPIRLPHPFLGGVMDERNSKILIAAAGEPGPSLKTMLLTEDGVIALADSKFEHKYGTGGWIDETNFILCGGQNTNETQFTTECEKYSTITGVWNTTAGVVPDQYSASYGIFQGNLYVIGGKTQNNSVSSDFKMFNSTSESWTDVGTSMDPPKYHAAAVVYQSSLVICGGYDSSNAKTDTCDAYGFQFGGWGWFPQMYKPRAHFSMALDGKYVYAVGDHAQNQRYHPHMWAFEDFTDPPAVVSNNGLAVLCFSNGTWP